MFKDLPLADSFFKNNKGYTTAIVLYLPVKENNNNGNINQSLIKAIKTIGNVTANIVTNLDKNLENYQLIKNIELSKDFSELLFNALHYGYGKIMIKSHLTENKKYAVVIFFDNGPGFSKKELSFVFKKGFTSRAKENGLGLYYLKKTMQRINGKIEIISNSQSNS